MRASVCGSKGTRRGRGRHGGTAYKRLHAIARGPKGSEFQKGRGGRREGEEGEGKGRGRAGVAR